MHKIKEQKGITLIALIITIILMLILVGVTVTVALNGGLFITAKQGTDQTQIETEKEQLLGIVMGAIGEDGKVNFNVLDNNLPEGFTKVGEKTYKSNVTGKTYMVSENGSITMVEEVVEGPFKLKVELSDTSPLSLLISYEIPGLGLTEENITDEQTISLLAQAFGVPGEMKIESYEELYLITAQMLTENPELTYEQLLVATGKEEPTTQDVFLYLMAQASQMEGMEMLAQIETPQQLAIELIPRELKLIINNDIYVSENIMGNNTRSFEFTKHIYEFGKYEISLEVDGIKDETVIEVNGQLVAEKKNWDLNKVEVKTEETTIVPIPKGFEVLKTAEKPQGYTIDEGLVITDGENEFVWVPVTNAKNYTEGDFGPLEGEITINATGKTTKWDSYQTIQHIYGTVLGEINSEETFDSVFTYAEDKANIERSIRTYGGFYVGRYETTYDELSNGVPQGIGVKPKKDVLTAEELLKPETETKPASNDNYKYRWWGLYKVQKDLYANNPNVGSVMISSNQWEAIMDYTKYGSAQRPFESYYSWVEDEEIATDPDKSASEYSNEEGEYDETKNIYDLAGNLYEWTMETNDTSSRVIRGCSYDYYSSNNRTASNKSGELPTILYNDSKCVRFSSHTLYKITKIAAIVT